MNVSVLGGDIPYPLVVICFPDAKRISCCFVLSVSHAISLADFMLSKYKVRWLILWKYFNRDV